MVAKMASIKGVTLQDGDIKRFWRHVSKGGDDECWEWLAAACNRYLDRLVAHRSAILETLEAYRNAAVQGKFGVVVENVLYARARHQTTASLGKYRVNLRHDVGKKVRCLGPGVGSGRGGGGSPPT